MRIAIAICTCKRPLLLDRVLARLAELVPVDAPAPALFALVVDNAPEENVREVCERRAGALLFPLHYVQEPVRGISHARNRAVAEALTRKADFLAFLDDDDLPERDWLAQLVRTQRASDAALVFGYWRLPEDAALPGWMADVPFLRPPPFEARSRRYDFPNWAGTYNILIARSVLEALRADGHVFQPDDALLGCEDVDFIIRAVRRGFRTASSAEALIVRDWEPARMTMRGLLRRAYRGGVIRVAIDRRHLAPEEFRRIRRRRTMAGLTVLWEMIKTPYRLLTGRRAAAMRAGVDAARWWGETTAALGLRYRYY